MASEEDEQMYIGLAFLLVLAVLAIYVLIGAVFEHYHFHLVHETGVGIMIGVLVGMIFYYGNEQFYQHLNFNGEFFFYVILPPIIFAGGYNLKKRKFFQNFSYISLYGVFGTLINFGVVFGLLSIMNDSGWIRRYSDKDTIINLDLTQVMLFSATICATDSVAALAMIKSDKYPKLFSVIFGEGMVNDSVSIILYKAVFDLLVHSSGDTSFHWYTLFELIWQFILNSFTSIFIGLAYGVLACVVTSKLPFLQETPTLETALVFMFGYMSYVTTEILDFSGVISILVCGIFMSHYLFYNLSSNAKIATGISFQFLAVIAEASLYMYLGLSSWSIAHDYWWSWTFVLGGFIICIIARFCGVFILSWIAILIGQREKWRLNRYEMLIIWFSGLIRGAIAFALIQTLPEQEHGSPDYEQSKRNGQVVKSTVLFIVMFTTIILGAIMPQFIEFNIRQIGKNAKYNSEHPSMKDTKEELNNSGEAKESKQYKSRIQLLWNKFDEHRLKPLLIFDYANRKDEIQRDKAKLKFSSEGFNQEISEVEIKTVHGAIENPLYSSLLANNSNSNSVSQEE